jgi:hypothetical protein
MERPIVPASALPTCYAALSSVLELADDAVHEPSTAIEAAIAEPQNEAAERAASALAQPSD